MEFIQEYDMLTAGERDTFTRACRRLLKQTFVVRDKNEDSRKLYFFIKRYEELLSRYLGFMGFELVVNHDTGVAMLRNVTGDSGESRVAVNRLQLRKIESIILCCFWTMYIDRLKSGVLTRAVTVTIAELRFELEKYGLRDKVDKTTLDNALHTFSGYQIAEVSGNIGDEDCVIRLYPSIEFCLDTEALHSFVNAATQRMMDVAQEGAE